MTSSEDATPATGRVGHGRNRPRSPDRIPVMLAALEAAWRTDTDLRLGQLIFNIDRDLEFLSRCEDHEMFEKIKKFTADRTLGD